MSLIDLREFFFWSSVINFSLLLTSILMILSFRRGIYKIHGSMFNISDKQLDVIWYSLIAGYKILVFAFNIVPYAALSIMAR